jgi:hypothetical protein
VRKKRFGSLAIFFTISTVIGMFLASGKSMTLQDLAEQAGAQLLLPGNRPHGGITRVCAGDRMSDLLEQAGPDALLVTRLANPHLFRMAELMDVPGVCLVLSGQPEPELVRAAEASGTALLVCSAGLSETRARLERCLREGAAR